MFGVFLVSTKHTLKRISALLHGILVFSMGHLTLVENKECVRGILKSSQEKRLSHMEGYEQK
jgi:hypothetical protein